MTLPIHFFFIIPVIVWFTLSVGIASERLENIPGDDLLERNPEQIDDVRIAVAIKHQLARIGGNAFSSIEVSVKHGVATLKGTADSLWIQQRAKELSQVIRGVRGVIDRISVGPVGSTTDAALKKYLEATFFDDPVVELKDIHLEVKRGRVTLEGRVQSWQEKQTLALFSRHSVLEKFSLDVSVRNGTVVLAGTVNSIYERNLAENVASKIRGVDSIQNHIVFSTKEEEKTDWEIQLDIENQIWWSAFLSEQDIVATVQDGKATLAGSVEYDHQRLIAEQQAFEAGASVVMNRLRVGKSRNYPDSRVNDKTN